MTIIWWSSYDDEDEMTAPSMNWTRVSLNDRPRFWPVFQLLLLLVTNSKGKPRTHLWPNGESTMKRKWIYSPVTVTVVSMMVVVMMTMMMMMNDDDDDDNDDVMKMIMTMMMMIIFTRHSCSCQYDGHRCLEGKIIIYTSLCPKMFSCLKNDDTSLDEGMLMLMLILVRLMMIWWW